MPKTQRFLSLFAFLLLFAANSKAQSDGLFDLRRLKEPKKWEDLTDQLILGLSSDSARVMAIYKWITGNISYDYKSYMGGEPIRFQSPERVYARRSTTCTGYSNLMVNMLKRAGIPATDVEGFTHDFTLGLDSTKLTSDHSWVTFKVNGKWFLADPTWDAGEIGIYLFTFEKKVKQSIWKRLKRFKFSYVFKKGKQNPRFIAVKRQVYREGFLRKPETNYLFIPAEKFLKTHLPNVAHFQLMADPISVEEFCDSIHSLGDHIYSNTGSFDFNSLNDTYNQLERPEKLLWLSDSTLLYHWLNHGDKAINAHNYLASFHGDRSTSIPRLEQFISLADTVILHTQLAIKLNRQASINKRKQFTNSFQAERKELSNQTLQQTRVKNHLARTPEIYRKGRGRIEAKEKLMLTKIDGLVYKNVSRVQRIDSFSSNDSKIQEGILRIMHLSDSIKKIQEIEILQGENYSIQLSTLTDSIQKGIEKHQENLYQGQFLNQWKVRQSDKDLSETLSKLNVFVKDSVNTLLSPRLSMQLLMQLDQELKKQQVIWKEWEKKDSSFSMSQANGFVYGLLMDRMDQESRIIEKRIASASEMEAYIKQILKPDLKSIAEEYKFMNRLRTLRMTYLNKMLNNKYNRSIKVYQSISTNAKNWKKNYQTKIKMLQK